MFVQGASGIPIPLEPVEDPHGSSPATALCSPVDPYQARGPLMAEGTNFDIRDGHGRPNRRCDTTSSSSNTTDRPKAVSGFVHLPSGRADECQLKPSLLIMPRCICYMNGHSYSWRNVGCRWMIVVWSDLGEAGYQDGDSRAFPQVLGRCVRTIMDVCDSILRQDERDTMGNHYCLSTFVLLERFSPRELLQKRLSHNSGPGRFEGSGRDDDCDRVDTCEHSSRNCSAPTVAVLRSSVTSPAVSGPSLRSRATLGSGLSGVQLCVGPADRRERQSRCTLADNEQ